MRKLSSRLFSLLFLVLCFSHFTSLTVSLGAVRELQRVIWSSPCGKQIDRSAGKKHIRPIPELRFPDIIALNALYGANIAGTISISELEERVASYSRSGQAAAQTRVQSLRDLGRITIGRSLQLDPNVRLKAETRRQLQAANEFVYHAFLRGQQRRETQTYNPWDFLYNENENLIRPRTSLSRGVTAHQYLALNLLHPYVHVLASDLRAMLTQHGAEFPNDEAYWTFLERLERNGWVKSHRMLVGTGSNTRFEWAYTTTDDGEATRRKIYYLAHLQFFSDHIEPASFQ